VTDRPRVLVHLGSGIGNIVLATPLVRVLARDGFVVDLLLDADYPGVGELFEGWSAVRRIYAGRSGLPLLTAYEHVAAAIPPFYWQRFRRRYDGLCVRRPPDALFYENEQAYYLEFARFLGCDVREAPSYFLPVPRRVPTTSIALAPGSKPAEMATKRWPFFAELAAALEDVVLVGTADDLRPFGRTPGLFPSHVRSLVGCLSLRETASLLAGAAAVVANDCGLGHLAGALGVPTVLLFGPTPHRTLGALPPNVTILRAGLRCEPCWFGARFGACGRRIDCLHELRVETVIQALTAVARIARTAVAQRG
jgi:ADP-heptose:LPS heptosyltransferase